jgi:predicted DNA-binding protein (MmcQ/YjbR family)
VAKAKAKNAKPPARSKAPVRSKPPAGPRLTPAEKALRALALGYPETSEHFPWGERVIKVRGKVFIFMGQGTPELSLSVKLPQTGTMALLLPFVESTGYGLGKAGWVTARFPSGADAPVDLIAEWIDESYRAVAPKSLAARLPEREAATAEPTPSRAPRRRRS